jgi:4-hydroxy-3-methylbut-2-enyl diphosphate reductase
MRRRRPVPGPTGRDVTDEPEGTTGRTGPPAEGVVVLAEPRGFCAGVRRAIGVVEAALDRHGPPVYVRKEIVHNAYVVSALRRRGAVFVDSEAAVPPGSVCVFSAHGVSPAVRSAAADRELRVIDATCPLVSKVHQEARRFARGGRTLLLIGHAEHEEVEGTRGEAPERTIVVESEAAAERLDLPADTPLAYLTQTTLSVDETAGVVDVLRRRFPDLVGPGTDDICYASQNRQDAVKELARRTDLVLVVGSPNSSNSIRMVEVAELAGTPAHLVPDVSYLDAGWFSGVGAVGLSAGASAPEVLVEEVLDRLRDMGYGKVQMATVATEDVVFSLPPAVAEPRGGSVTDGQPEAAR